MARQTLLSNQIIGAIFVSFVGISFAVNSTLASIAYQYGASPLSFLTSRTVVAVILIFVVIRISKVSTRLPAKVRWTAIGMGLILALYSYGLLGSIQYVPVALGVLTFYLFPVLTSIGAWGLGQEKLTIKTILCVVLAFIGLGIALGVGDDYDVIGISLALGAAILITVLLLVGNSLGSGFDPRIISLHVTCSAAIAVIIVDVIFFEFPIPREKIGILAFIVGALFYAFAVIGMFIGLVWIGAIRTSLFMNFEPVASVVMGALILDQVLAPIQLFGAGLVIFAIFLAAIQYPK